MPVHLVKIDTMLLHLSKHTVSFPNCINVICFVLMWYSGLRAQCGPVISEPNCSVPGAIEVSEGAVVGAGQTYVVTNPTTLSSLTVNGGTLIICSTLSVTNFNFASGNVVVTSGSVLNITNNSVANVFGNGCTLINFGAVNTACSVVTGPNNLIYNYSLTSSFNLPFNQLVVQGPNTQFINNGVVTSSFVINTSTNTIQPFCLGAGSMIVTGLMINEYPNGFAAPDGMACINIYNSIINSQLMTDTSNTFICYLQASVNIIGSPNFGSATVDNSCSGCFDPLGPNVVWLRGANDFGGIELEWQLEDMHELEIIEVQRLKKGSTSEFEPHCFVSKLSADGQGRFRYLDTEVNMGEWYYYRLKLHQRSDEVHYSEVVPVFREQYREINVFPNPAVSNVISLGPDVQISGVFNVLGQLLDYSLDGNRLVLDPELHEKVILITGKNRKGVFSERLMLSMH